MKPEDWVEMPDDSIVREHNGAVHHAQESNAGDYGKQFTAVVFSPQDGKEI